MNLSRRDAFRLAQGTLQATKVNFVSLPKQNQKQLNWNRPPLLFLGYMSSSAIWLLQNFLPTTYRPPLPSRLLSRNLKPSKSTTGKFYYLLPKSYKRSLFTADIASLVCTTLNWISIIEINTE